MVGMSNVAPSDVTATRFLSGERPESESYSGVGFALLPIRSSSCCLKNLASDSKALLSPPLATSLVPRLQTITRLCSFVGEKVADLKVTRIRRSLASDIHTTLLSQ